MAKSSEQKVNFYEQIAEVRVAQIIEEEQQLEAASADIKEIKAKTAWYLDQMANAALEGNEEKRREFRNEVVVLNMRLVTQVLKKYGYFNPDKFQNGCIGLLKAADTFNVEKGVPFGNYAAFCIETEVRLAFKRVNRAFEGKAQGYLDSLDAPSTLGNGDEVDKHETICDPFAEQEFDGFIEEAEVDTLFYDIIIPSIQQYGTRTRDIDMDLWQKLEIQYFIELSMEQSQRQRITFTEMASQLNTTPQNLRVRHKKVMELVRERCLEYGYRMSKAANGRVSFYLEEEATFDVPPRKKGKKY